MKSDVLTANAAVEITTLKNRVAELEALVKYYEEQFRLSKHRQFGAKSEKSEYDFVQLSIFNEVEATADKTVAEPELVEVEKHYRKRTRLTTDKLPEDLPVETVTHELPPEERICPDCDGHTIVPSGAGVEPTRDTAVPSDDVKLADSCRRGLAHTGL